MAIDCQEKNYGLKINQRVGLNRGELLGNTKRMAAVIIRVRKNTNKKREGAKTPSP